MKLAFIEMAGFRGFRDKVRIAIPRGFLVVTGRNGSGKSTILDAIDYVFTGTLSKFDVKAAKGGGLADHIWWVGEGAASDSYVTVGLTDDKGHATSFTRSRDGGPDFSLKELSDVLSTSEDTNDDWARILVQTSLLRDETIAGLSLDQGEQERANAVQSAIGGLTGKDSSKRTSAILASAKATRDHSESRAVTLNGDLSRALSSLSEARSLADKSQDLAKAEAILLELEPGIVLAFGYRQEFSAALARRKMVIEDLASALSLFEETQKEIFEDPADEAELKKIVSDLEHDLLLKRHEFLLADASGTELKAEDENAADMAALLSHGQSIGLVDGHCPLCDATKTNQEFSAALQKARDRLSERAKDIELAYEHLASVASELRSSESEYSRRLQELELLRSRRRKLDMHEEQVNSCVRNVLSTLQGKETGAAEEVLIRAQGELSRLVQAHEVYETSLLKGLVSTAEQRLATIRVQVEAEAIRLAAAERACEVAKQIDAAAKSITTQILNERFDTVMPLLKELYRRLRPHTEWREIESEFGGKVRASLNFTVGDGCNPQFLFSSGQRRAAGLAFLLAIHLSRPWCRWQSLLLDDPVQHIDDFRALNLVEVLGAIRKTSRQVVVVVENEALAEVLARRLRALEDEPGTLIRMAMKLDGSAGIDSIRQVGAFGVANLRTA